MPVSTQRRPCVVCRRWFRPSPRLKGRQTVCPEKPCQRARQAANELRWKRANPGHRKKAGNRSSATYAEVPSAGEGKSILSQAPASQAVDQGVLPVGLGKSIQSHAFVLAALVARVPLGGAGKSIRARLSELHAQGSTLFGGGR
jgi:hypothetical protein